MIGNITSTDFDCTTNSTMSYGTYMVGAIDPQGSYFVFLRTGK